MIVSSRRNDNLFICGFTVSPHLTSPRVSNPKRGNRGPPPPAPPLSPRVSPPLEISNITPPHYTGSFFFYYYFFSLFFFQIVWAVQREDQVWKYIKNIYKYTHTDTPGGQLKYHVVCPRLCWGFTTAAWPSGCLPDTKKCAFSPELPTHTVCCGEYKVWTMGRKTEASFVPTRRLKTFRHVTGFIQYPSHRLSVRLPVRRSGFILENTQQFFIYLFFWLAGAEFVPTVWQSERSHGVDSLATPLKIGQTNFILIDIFFFSFSVHQHKGVTKM